MGTEVMSIIFNMIIQVLLIAFVFFILYIFAWKPFLRYLSERQAAVMSAQDEAEKAKEEATKLSIEAKAKLQEVNQKTDSIIETAEETAKQIVVQQREAAQAEINKRLEVADKQLDQDRRRLNEEMQQKTVELASDLAAQFLSAKSTEKETEKQIEDFLEKIGE